MAEQTDFFGSSVSTTPKSTGGSLATARQMVRDGARDGIDCPCCGQLCKVYRRRVTATHARILIGLVAAHKKHGGPVLTKQIPLGKGDARTAGGAIGKLALFHLVRYHVEGGRWSPTELGIEFVKGKRVALDWVDMLNGVRIAQADNCRTIKEALGEKFDLDKVWNEAKQKCDSDKH